MQNGLTQSVFFQRCLDTLSTIHYPAYKALLSLPCFLPPFILIFNSNSLASIVLIQTTGKPFFVTITSSLVLSISDTICVALSLSSVTVINFIFTLQSMILF